MYFLLSDTLARLQVDGAFDFDLRFFAFGLALLLHHEQEGGNDRTNNNQDEQCDKDDAAFPVLCVTAMRHSLYYTLIVF